MLHSLRSSLRVVGLAACLASPVSAQLLVAGDAGGSTFVVDPTDARLHSIARLPASIGVLSEFAYDFISNTLYATSSTQDQLFRIDLTNNSVTAVGTGLNSGAQFFHGLTYDVVNSTLWAVPTSSNSLYSIDPATGLATLVGPTGVTRFVNLAYALPSDTLYALATIPPSLHTIDRATGAATMVAQLPAGYHPTALTYDIASGLLFGAENGLNEIFTIDPVTGTTTTIGNVNTNMLALEMLTGPAYRREAHACGTLDLDFRGAPLLGSNLSLTLGGAGTGLPFIGLGFQPANSPTPFCSCIAGHEWSDAIPGATLMTTIPSSPALSGLDVAFQGATLAGTGGCPSPAVSLSDTLVFRLF